MKGYLRLTPLDKLVSKGPEAEDPDPFQIQIRRSGHPDPCLQKPPDTRSSVHPHDDNIEDYTGLLRATEPINLC